MKKTIMITGATDGIGYVTAKNLVQIGHKVLIHGRNPEKVKRVATELNDLGQEKVLSFVADLSDLKLVQKLADEVKERDIRLDVLTNNAGVFKTRNPITPDNLDVRFVVNTIAPYLLTKLLFPFFAEKSRVINLSSAAQAPINIEALKGNVRLGDMEAYAQSKLAITSWTSFLAKKLANKKNAIFIAVNPGSLLASKMVKEGFGVSGKDINIGARILEKLATSAEFEDANGKYFDNDIGRLTSLHPDVLNKQKSEALITTLETLTKLD